MQTTRRTVGATLGSTLLVSALVLAYACGDDDGSATGDDAGGEAGSGDATGGGSCEADQTCDFSCRGECSVECLGGRCNAECPEGGCTLDADFGATTAYRCDGGGCTVDCDGASDCTIDCQGGGCIVGCDGDSRCKVSCGEGGEPCVVGCEAGALATCDNDNCELMGCEVCDATDVDDSYQPSLDPADYAAVVDNPLFPLTVGAKWVYQAEGEVITVEVLSETYTTATGIECVVVQDTVTTPQGVLIEDTHDWFAQDADGNVWYMGEDTAEYVNGVKANTRGSWEAGVDGALPGIIVHGTIPEVGTVYRQEYYRCEAEDIAEIIAIDEAVNVEAGRYEGCVRIREYSALDPLSNEHKLFCPGVGVALVEELAPGADSGEPAEMLESFVPP